MLPLIHDRNPGSEATMHDDLMPPWTYVVGAATGLVTGLVGIVDPASLNQWLTVIFSACYMAIFLYGYWIRTTRQPAQVRDQSESFQPRKGSGPDGPSPVR